jgi:AraC-like DNA-binding protein
MAVVVSESETENAELVRTSTEERTSLSALLSELLSAMESARIKLLEILEILPVENPCNLPATLPSTGGRPAFDIKKEHIVQLRDAGMDWKAISRFLGISEKTLQRRRSEFGLTASFSDICDIHLDRQVAEILQLTPYSGETYVRGSLKGRKIHVQRERVRESIHRVDPIGRSILRSNTSSLLDYQ